MDLSLFIEKKIVTKKQASGGFWKEKNIIVQDLIFCCGSFWSSKIAFRRWRASLFRVRPYSWLPGTHTWDP